VAVIDSRVCCKHAHVGTGRNMPGIQNGRNHLNTLKICDFVSHLNVQAEWCGHNTLRSSAADVNRIHSSALCTPGMGVILWGESPLYVNPATIKV